VREEERQRSTLRKMAAVATIIVLAAVVGTASAAEDDSGKLRQGFYEQSCPRAEQIVRHYMEQHVPHAPSVAATLLRTHFHDCFVRVRTALSPLQSPCRARRRLARPRRR
jgi:hypothetical protein